MKQDVLTKTVIVMIVAVIITSVMKLDLMWFCLELIGIFIILYPYMRMNGSLYHRGFLWALISLHATFLVFLAASLVFFDIGVCLYKTVSLYDFTSISIMAFTSAVYGLMIAVLLDRITDLEISKRWMIIIGMIFSVSVATFYAFPLFVNMYCNGLPVFNEDFSNTGERITNHLLALPGLTAIIATMITGFLFHRAVRNTSKNKLFMKERRCS